MERPRKPILQGEYRLVRQLETTEHSTLYLATSLHNPDREFLVTEIALEPADLAADQKEMLAWFRERALRYVDLVHPGIATLKDFFVENGSEYLIFEHLGGHRLSEVMALRNRAFTEPQAVDVALRVAEILEWMHSRPQALYCADLHPGNVLLMPRGRIMLTDFGLSKILAPFDPAEPRLGSAGYAPPEQYGEDAVIGRATDVYALGALMYHLVTGLDPGERPGVFGSIESVNPAVSEDYQAIVDRATQPDARLRYQDMREMIADLKALSPARRAAAENRPSLLERLRDVLRRPFVAA